MLVASFPLPPPPPPPPLLLRSRTWQRADVPAWPSSSRREKGVATSSNDCHRFLSSRPNRWIALESASSPPSSDLSATGYLENRERGRERFETVNDHFDKSIDLRGAKVIRVIPRGRERKKQ